MPTLLNTKGLSHRLDQLICNAKERIILISPFVAIPDSLITRINIANEAGIEVNIVYGIRSRLKPYERERFQKVKNLTLFFHPHLHAKAYLNEFEAIVCSLNLNDTAHNNSNIELGVHFTRAESKDMYNSLVVECTSIFHESRHRQFDILNGFCIHCKDSIERDIEYPFCLKCYLYLKDGGRLRETQSYCHLCGANADTSIDEPLCNGSHN